MVVLRDGEWSVWCPRCPWRSRPAVTLALALASRHICGSGGRPAVGDRAAASSQPKGGCLTSSQEGMRMRAGASDLFPKSSEQRCSSAGPLNLWEVMELATVGGRPPSATNRYLGLAALPVHRALLGAGMRPIHGPALAVGALHLRPDAHGRQHHAKGRGLLPIHGDRRGGTGLRGVGPTTGK